jgi:DnaK suppressor protein
LKLPDGVQNCFMAKRKPVRRAATREDLLGIPVRRARVPAKWRDYHDKLLQTREMIARQQAGLSRNEERVRVGTGMHMADAGTDSFDQDLALGILSSDRDTLFEIDRALERIRSGAYGICELTGKPIGAKRLAAIPWTRFSAQAERQLEKEGLHNRARLPDRGATALLGGSDSDESEEAE